MNLIEFSEKYGNVVFNLQTTEDFIEEFSIDVIDLTENMLIQTSIPLLKQASTILNHYNIEIASRVSVNNKYRAKEVIDTATIKIINRMKHVSDSDFETRLKADIDFLRQSFEDIDNREK